MPRRSATFVKDDTATARGAHGPEHNTTPRRSSRASAKEGQFPASEGRRSQRSSSASQTVTESRVTRSRNSTTSKKEGLQSNISNCLGSKDGLEIPTSRVRTSRRSTGRVNYKESDGEEELTVPGSEKGYMNDMSFELDSERNATNKRKPSQLSPKPLSPSKPISSKVNVSVQNKQYSGAEDESVKQTSISHEQNMEPTVSVRRKSREIVENNEGESLQLRRSSRRTRQISDSVEPDGKASNRISKASGHRENPNKRPVRGKAKTKTEFSEAVCEVMESDISQVKCEQIETGDSRKQKRNSHSSEPNKRLKLTSKIESISNEADSKDKAITDIGIEDETKESFVAQHECTIIYNEPVKGDNHVHSVSEETTAEDMDIDEPISNPAVKISNVVDSSFQAGGNAKSDDKIPDETIRAEVSIIKLPSKPEEVNQNNHSNDILKSCSMVETSDIIKESRDACPESTEKKQCDNSKNNAVKEMPLKEKYSGLINDKHHAACPVLTAEESKNVSLQSNISKNLEKNHEDVVIVDKISSGDVIIDKTSSRDVIIDKTLSRDVVIDKTSSRDVIIIAKTSSEEVTMGKISSNVKEIVLMEPDKSMESRSESLRDCSLNVIKCAMEKSAACLESENIKSAKNNLESMKNDQSTKDNAEGFDKVSAENLHEKSVENAIDRKNTEILDKNVAKNLDKENSEHCNEGITEICIVDNYENGNKMDAKNCNENKVENCCNEDPQTHVDKGVEKSNTKNLEKHDNEDSAKAFNVEIDGIKTQDVMRKETNADTNGSSSNIICHVDRPSETSLNGSETVDQSIPTAPSNAMEIGVELCKSVENVSAKANGARNTSHVVDNIHTKETSFFFPGRRYVLNPSMTEEIRFPLKNRMFGFASFNLGSKVRNCSSQKDKLICELRKLQTDIICLQEITKSFFNDILEPSLDALGYKGIIHVPEENFTGLASFYKKSTFRLSGFSEASLIKLIEKDLEASSLEPCDKTAVLSYMKKCGNVLLTQFCAISEECTLTVANVLIPPSDISTHALQMSCLVREVVTMIEGSTKPLLLCGAFNMAEDEAAYQLLRDGYLTNEMIEELQKKKDVNLPEKENAALLNLLWKAFQHPSSNLCSCYASVLGHELLVPGVQKSASPDLLWFSSDCLQTVGVLDIVSAPPEKIEDFHYSLKATVAFSLPRK